MRRTHLVLTLLVVLLGGAATRAAPDESPEGWRSTLAWRCIGPANMGGRITALAVCESDSSLWWAATASGGLLRTINNGTTFEHQFDREGSVSIGDVAVAPSDPNVVWLGTGEANPRNSVSWGDGVYKSVDGGKTWTRMGLAKSFQIGAVVIHPTNPDIVYVGALGRLWGPSEERGLYKTVDGGASWTKILGVDERTGVVDVQMHPSDPETLLVATYDRQRDGFDSNDPARKWGPGSGIHKTTDGGRTFREITSGLPSCALGRIGIAYAPCNPKVVYAVVESERVGQEPANAPYLGIVGENAEVGARLTRILQKGPSAAAGLKVGDIVLSLGGEKVHSYAELIRFARHHVAGDTVKLEVVRERKTIHVDLKLGKRPRSRGRSPRTMFTGSLGGQRANLQDQQGAEGHEYGGLYRSGDGGETWTRVNTLNPRPMYFSEVRVDPRDENRVYVLGINLWQSKDGGKTFTPDAARGCHVDHHALWIDGRDPRRMILGTDGGIYVTHDRGVRWDHLNHVAIGQFYHVALDSRRAYRVYGGLQDNGCWGGPSRVRSGSGPTNADWIRLGGGDGFVCRVDREDPDLVYFEMQYGGIGRLHLRTGERGSLRPRAPRGTRYRFNWNTPFVLSHHNSRIFYSAGNVVFRSLDRGTKLRRISPEIAHTKGGSATALAESPLDPDLLYVGSDDGAMWTTRDGGHTWLDLFAAGRPPAAEDRPPEADPVARLKAAMRRLDRDRDGTLHPDELGWAAASTFRLIDTNGDGAIDATEIDTRAREVAARLSRPRRDRASRRSAAAGSRPLAALVPDRRWVSWIEASRFAPARAYLVLDGHRSDDDRPHVYVTEDHGATWRSLGEGLPEGCGTTRVLREDLVNENLLYLGTEFGAWVSLDRGASWTSLNTNLPTVAVHAFALHPTAGEIVAATHGRSLWILDVTVLRQLDEAALETPAHLFEPATAIQWRPEPRRGRSRTYVGKNPSDSADIVYRLATKLESVKLEIRTLDGKLVRTLKASADAGFQRASWDLRWTRPRRSRSRVGPRARPGTYRVVLTAGEQTLTRDLRLEIDPDHPDERWVAGADLAEELESRYQDEKRIRRSPWLQRGPD